LCLKAGRGGPASVLQCLFAGFETRQAGLSSLHRCRRPPASRERGRGHRR